MESKTHILKRKNSHKEHINNPKAKKYKHETTLEENFRASLLKEFKRKFYEREKIIQQKEHEFEMKKMEKDKITIIIRQPLNRADRDLFHCLINHKRIIFPKIKFITNQEQLHELKKPGSLGYNFVQ